MTGKLIHIWRHPIKAHGREAVDRIAVISGATLPGDRKWAVAHEAAKTDGHTWAPCANFSRGSKAPALMAIDAFLNDTMDQVTLTHPKRDDITFCPDKSEDLGRFLDWVSPLMPADRAQSANIFSVPRRGMTDAAFPSISFAGNASLQALSKKTGTTLDPRRFRINFWADGLEPWEEFDWVGREIAIGETRYKVEERIQRCLATTANPETGERDADILGGLIDGWGHKDLGVQLVALTDGEAAIGDKVAVV